MKISEKLTKKTLIKYIDELVVKIELAEGADSKFYVIYEDGDIQECADFAEVKKVVGQTELEHLNDNTVIKGQKYDFEISLKEAA